SVVAMPWILGTTPTCRYPTRASAHEAALRRAGGCGARRGDTGRGRPAHRAARVDPDRVEAVRAAVACPDSGRERDDGGDAAAGGTAARPRLPAGRAGLRRDPLPRARPPAGRRGASPAAARRGDA